jgi:hypothetical protein
MSVKVGRNDPCPCGSGRKYKHCCGRSPLETRPSTQAQQGRRHCGECAACCDGWVKMAVYGHEVYPGKPCPFSTGKGCRIYERRPDDPCKNFVCGWLSEGSFLPEWFRPDRAGCIVIPAKLTWQRLPVDVVVPVGKKIKPKSLAWLKDHARQHGRALIYGEGNEIWAAYGPAAFQQDMAARLQAGEALW